MAGVLLAVLALGLTIYAVIDCVQTPDERVRNMPKLAWLALIVIAVWVGPIAWIFAGRPQATPPWGPLGRRGTPPSGPRGPEDDPDFLRGL